MDLRWDRCFLVGLAASRGFGASGGLGVGGGGLLWMLIDRSVLLVRGDWLVGGEERLVSCV